MQMSYEYDIKELLSDLQYKIDWVYFECVVFTSITQSIFLMHICTALMHDSLLYTQWVESPSRGAIITKISL